MKGLIRGLKRADLRSKRGPSSLRGRRTDRRRYERTSRNSPLCPTGHQPFGAAAQKVSKTLVPLFNLMTLDQWTDRWMDRQSLLKICVSATKEWQKFYIILNLFWFKVDGLACHLCIPFLENFIYLFIYSFILLFIYSYNDTFIHLLTHSCIHSLFLSLMNEESYS